MTARLTAILLSCLAAAAPADTISFESPADLTPYAVTNVSYGSFSQAAGSGAGSPATGGLIYQGDSSANDRGFVARKPLAVAQTDGVWTTSLLINPRDFDSTTSDKAEMRVGFSAGNSVNASKPWEFFNKNNESISVKLKAEHKPADLKDRQFECELTNFSTSELKYLTLTQNSSPYFDHWLRLSLTMVRASGGFTASYKLESLGADGTSAPVEILNSGPAAIANASLAAAATTYAGFSAKLEKSKTTAVYLDDHAAGFTAVAPESPSALPAASVAAQAFLAEWQPSATGVVPESYVLEVTTAADNFAPGTYIAADGATGQASGIAVAGGGTGQLVSGLFPETEYLYRVRAVNSVGSSAASSAVPVTTLSLTDNAPPTLDALADVGPLSLSETSVVIPLTGITTGGEEGQPLVVSALSGDPSIASPSVSYNSPDATGTLTLALGGIQGSTTITVTVDDGEATDNTVQRSFTVSLRNPPEVLAFESASDLDELTVGVDANVVHNWFSGAGAGDPASGGVVVSSGAVTSGDRGFVGWRNQGHPLAGASLLRTSILVNASLLDDVSSEGKLELRVGFTPTLVLGASKPSEFLHKTNEAICVSLKAEHKPSDAGKLRKVEAEIGSLHNGIESKAGKFGLLNTPAINSWLRVQLTLVPVGNSTFQASYVIDDLGTDGTSSPVTILESGPFPIENPAVAGAGNVFAAYSGKMDKELTYLQLDDHRSVVLNDPPSTPGADAATMVTATSFRANWHPEGEVYPTSWLLEVVPDGSAFEAGNFIAADGSTGQPQGIVIPDGDLRSLRVGGLPPASSFRYRLVGTNLNGASAPSAETPVTTLASGINAPPTLDVIPNPAPIAIDGAGQTISLTGITDGGEGTQTLAVTALSSNPSLVPHPLVTYTSPGQTGSLDFAPAPGAVGNAVITVTVDDGGLNNSTFQRTFTVVVVDPAPVINFDDPADYSKLGIATAHADLVHAPAGGTGGSGGIAFTGTTSGTDRSAFVVRPTAFDAASASYLLTSLDFNAAEVLDIASGKDKGEIRLGFLGDNTPHPTNIKDTMNKAHPSLGVKFSIEEEVGKADKHRKLEGEIFSWNGVTETKAEKLTLTGVADADHWFRVTMLAVRSGSSQFSVSYVIDDMGADGTTFSGRVLESAPVSISPADFAADNSVFSTFTVTDEKTGSSTLAIDRFESVVNTTAPWAPATQQVSAISQEGFTVNWTAPLEGAWAEGFIVEIVDEDAPFLPGYFYGEDGTPGQAEGILVDNPFSEDLSVYGLDRLHTYRIRVRAYGEAPDYDESAALNRVFATTIYGPGLEFADWQLATFEDDAFDPLVAGPGADPDHDGIPNLLEYALGLDALAPDAHKLPQADLSGPYLRISYRRRHNVAGVAYEPAASGDLGGWHPEQTVEVSVSQPDEEGMETVVVEDIYPKETFGRRFLRVGVETTD